MSPDMQGAQAILACLGGFFGSLSGLGWVNYANDGEPTPRAFKVIFFVSLVFTLPALVNLWISALLG